jgi:hypothetical protein
MATTEPHATGVRAEDLQPLLDGRYAALRHQIRELLSRPAFGIPDEVLRAPIAPR